MNKQIHPKPHTSLVGACSRFGNPYRTCDDGFGPLWVYRESLGILGIVRAQTWEDAFGCVLDAIMSDADETDPENWAGAETGELPEGIHFRPSGPPTVNGLNSGLASEDLNGSLLDPLTVEFLREHEIRLQLTAD
jgi:hypothetical protein